MEKQSINFALIQGNPTRALKVQAAKSEMERVSYVSLSDCLVNRYNGGQTVIEQLHKEMDDQLKTGRYGELRKWKIKLNKNEWGESYNPGDKYNIKRIKLIKDDAGNKLGGRYINDMVRRGEGEKRYDTTSYTLDKDCCINCTFHDALITLVNYGIHYENKSPEGNAIPLTGRKEISGGPSRAPDGQMRTIWYWRCEEVPPWTEEKQRGRPKGSSTANKEP